MIKKSDKASIDPKEGLESEIGGLFKTLGNAVDLLGQLAEAGAKRLQHQGEFSLKGLGDGARGVYGFSIRSGRVLNRRSPPRAQILRARISSTPLLYFFRTLLWSMAPGSTTSLA